MPAIREAHAETKGELFEEIARVFGVQLDPKPLTLGFARGGAFSYLRPGGAFYQFTYGPTCPISRPVLDRLGLKAKLVDRAMLNMPPAAVYKLTRRPQFKVVTSPLSPSLGTLIASEPNSGNPTALGLVDA